MHRFPKILPLNWVIKTIAIVLFVLAANPKLHAQDEKTQTALAQQYLENKEFAKAIPVFKALYEKAPFDKNLYDNYLSALMQNNSYEDAEKLVNYMMKIRRDDPAMLVDLGLVYEAEKKNKQAKEQYDQALQLLTGDEYKTKSLSEAFEKAGKNDYAVKVYEQIRKMVQNPYIYATQLSLLYSKMGKTKEAIQATLDLVMTQPNIMDDVKESLAKISDKDPKAFSIIQKVLNSRIKEQDQNPFWHELVSWLFIQKNDYSGAFKELTTLDQNIDEQGKRLIPFAQEITQDGEYETALKSYDYVIGLGHEKPFYELAAKGKMELLLLQFENKWPDSKNDLSKLVQSFTDFFQQFPNYQSSDIWRNYAMVQARYNHNPDTAIQMLSTAISDLRASKEFMGRCKLDMGDYYILENKIWEATLIYAQVDKDFKQDYLGEEARFRNAKLAYYRGDFDWAQGQLSVLKASTTKLIANDALYLSVLITENIPADSNMAPLLRFAAADLLLFQHKTKESDQLLDSISKNFPQTALQDDIDLLRSKIALEEGRTQDAINYLKDILEKFGTDVLADDATFQLAKIYEEKLKDKEKAKYYYEKIILDYPGSTFIQEARAKYNGI